VFSDTRAEHPANAMHSSAIAMTQGFICFTLFTNRKRLVFASIMTRKQGALYNFEAVFLPSMFDANISLGKSSRRRFPGYYSDAIARESHPTSPFLAEPYNLKYQNRKRQIITVRGFEVNHPCLFRGSHKIKAVDFAK
jgi:hypothetical protein